MAISTNLYDEFLHPLLKHLQGFSSARGLSAGNCVLILVLYTKKSTTCALAIFSSKHQQIKIYDFLDPEETMKVVHVKAISHELQKLEESGTTIQKEKMCLLLVHHLDVCSRVIEFCLTCDKAVYVYSHSVRNILITFIKVLFTFVRQWSSYSQFQLITDCIEIISVYSSLEEAKQNHVKVLECVSSFCQEYMSPRLLYYIYIYCSTE